MNFSSLTGKNIVVSDLMTAYKIKGRPEWMYFDWIPIRLIRAFVVGIYKRRWIKAGNRVVIRNKKVVFSPYGIVMDRLTYNELMNQIPIYPYYEGHTV